MNVRVRDDGCNCVIIKSRWRLCWLGDRGAHLLYIIFYPVPFPLLLFPLFLYALAFPYSVIDPQTKLMIYGYCYLERNVVSV